MFRKMNLCFCPFALAMAISIWLEACPSELPAFAGGIRVTTSEVLLEDQNASLAISDALDVGNLQSSIGPGIGTATSFSGFTDLNGLDDHVNATTNAYWTISANFIVSSAPNCPGDQATHPYPIGGGEEDFICLQP